jgi:phosphopantetheinyl transferase
MWGSCLLTDDEREILEPYLSPRERLRVSTLTENLASRYLAGRYLSRQLGASILRQDWSDIIPEALCPDCEQDHGPLSIQGTDVNISVSYSSDRAVALAARGFHIGVDLEQGEPTEKRSVGLHTLTLQQWCDYEAVIKADGRGMLIDINDVKISESSGEKRGQVRDRTALYAFVPLEAPAGFVVSAVIEKYRVRAAQEAAL